MRYSTKALLSSRKFVKENAPLVLMGKRGAATAFRASQEARVWILYAAAMEELTNQNVL